MFTNLETVAKVNLMDRAFTLQQADRRFRLLSGPTYPLSALAPATRGGIWRLVRIPVRLVGAIHPMVEPASTANAGRTPR